MVRIAVALLILLLAGCSSRAPAPDARLSDSAKVRTVLNYQLNEWRGTPYRFGGLSRRGVDCSGFVYRTFRDRFGILLPRTTEKQSEVGTRIKKVNCYRVTWYSSKPAGAVTACMSVSMTAIISLFMPPPAVA